MSTPINSRDGNSSQSTAMQTESFLQEEGEEEFVLSEQDKMQKEIEESEALAW